MLSCLQKHLTNCKSTCAFVVCATNKIHSKAGQARLHANSEHHACRTYINLYNYVSLQEDMETRHFTPSETGNHSSRQVCFDLACTQAGSNTEAVRMRRRRRRRWSLLVKIEEERTWRRTQFLWSSVQVLKSVEFSSSCNLPGEFHAGAQSSDISAAISPGGMYTGIHLFGGDSSAQCFHSY